MQMSLLYKKGLRYFLTIIIFSMCATILNAQNIKGKVTDAITGEPLIGATVSLKETKFSTIVNLDGSYSFKNVPAGKYDVKVKHSGYEKSKEKDVEIKTGQVAKNIDFQLSIETKNLDAAFVKSYGNPESDNTNRKIEKNSDVVQNNLSEKAIQLMPDVTVANAMQRISGVTVERTSSGEGRYAIIRGMDQRYNNTLVNGIKIPSPDDKFRYVPMDIFPSDLLERLEVIKTLTPAMEGDAIGGTMNLVMKNAPDKFKLNINAAGGYNTLFNDRAFMSFDKKAIQQKDPSQINSNAYTATDKDFSRSNLDFKKVNNPINAQLGFTAGNRYFNKRLGVVLGVSFQNTYRGSNTSFFHPNAQPTVAPRDNYPAFDDIYIRQYSTQQKRTGINNKLDYVINSNNKISLYNLYLNMDEYQSRYTVDSSLAIQRTGPGSGNVAIYNRSRFQKQSIYNSTLQGEHILSKLVTLKWNAVYSLAKQNVPDQAEYEVDHSVSTDAASGKSTETPSYVNGMDRIWRRNSDQDLAAYLNLIITPVIAKRVVEISTGGLARHKDRDNYYNAYKLGPKNSGQQAFTNIYDAQYSFNTVEAGKGSPINPNSYTSKEDVLAGYVQAKFMLTKKLQILGGVRIENTKQKFETVMPETFDGRYGTISYTDVLPSVHFKYAIDKKQNLRLSYYKALSRPGFFEVLPYRIAGEFYQEGGNPYLKHTTADNIDFRYEFFPNGADQFLIGGFYKKLHNPIEISILRFGIGQQILQPNNFGDAENYGIEAVATKFFGKFGVNANYTFTKSKITTTKNYYYRDNTTGDLATKSVSQSRPLQGQANHVGNISLLYKNDKIGLDIQAALVYTGERIVQVSPYYGLDYWQSPYTQFDFSFEKKIGKQFAFYGKLNNLLNSINQVVIKQPNFLRNGNNQLPEQKYDDKIIVQRDNYNQAYLFGIRFKMR